MKTFLLKNWKTILFIIAAIVIIILILHDCTGKNKTVTTTVVTHDTIKGDSIKYTVTVQKPVIKKEYLHDTLYKTISCDSARGIVKDWSEVRLYSDSVRNERQMFVGYKAIVFHNKLDTIKFDLSNLRPVSISNTTTTTTVLPIKNRFYLGGNLSYDFGLNKPAIGVGMLIVTKKNLALSVTINTSKIVEAGLFYRLGK